MDEKQLFGSDSEGVDRLLALGLDEADEAPEGPDSSSTVPLAHLLEAVDDQINQYKLVSLLGEGGFGMVYLAEQQEPVKRRVALKLIKPGMDSRQVIARFEVERQALALLDHPNIARVFDAGTTRAGRPYFAMEYVKGVSIIEHCDRHRLSIEDRLELFLQVCAGIQHAHQKGIIHRDLKPSNLLVSFEHEETVPKVIDFGVAKAISQPLTERTLYTERGQLIGTLEYMSPEQAEITCQDIDTRSDIYALGVVLYELLTGVRPFESQTLREGGPDHLRQVIREQDPKTPSTRLSHLAREDCTRIARRRQAEAGTLRRKLRGDLDWITLKALAKDRTRRYGSAGELAADLQRHLNHEPVMAGSPGALYRVRKYVRRHRALVTGLAAVLVVLSVGVAGMGVFAVKADRQARTAQAVAGFLIDDLLGSLSPEQLQSPSVSAHSLLDKASRRLEGKFAGQPREEARIRQALGDTYVELGDYKAAEREFQRAYDLRRQHLGDDAPLTLTSMSHLGRAYFLQGRLREAEPLLLQSLESRRLVLVPEHRDTLESSVWLGLWYVQRAGVAPADEAQNLLTTAFESCRRLLGGHDPITLEALWGLAFLDIVMDVPVEEAEGWCRDGARIARRELGEGHRLTRQFLALLAWFDTEDGEYEQAEHNARTALEMSRPILGQEHPDTLFAMGTLGIVHTFQSRLEEAGDQLGASVPRLRRCLGDEHIYTIHFTQWLCEVYLAQGRYQEAEPLITKTLEDLRRSLGGDHGLVMTSQGYLMRLYAMQGRADELKAWCATELRRLDPSRSEDRALMAWILHRLALMQATYPFAAIHDAAEAVRNAARACELTDGTMMRYRETLAAAYAAAGDFDNAIQEEQKALELSKRDRRFLSLPPEVARYHLARYQAKRAKWRSLTTNMSGYRIVQGEYEKAEQELTAALAAARRYLGESHPEVRGCICMLVELYEVWGKPEQAEKWRAQLPPGGPAAIPTASR